MRAWVMCDKRPPYRNQNAGGLAARFVMAEWTRDFLDAKSGELRHRGFLVASVPHGLTAGVAGWSTGERSGRIGSIDSTRRDG
jgi:hypothetical protein